MTLEDRDNRVVVVQLMSSPGRAKSIDDRCLEFRSELEAMKVAQWLARNGIQCQRISLSEYSSLVPPTH